MTLFIIAAIILLVGFVAFTGAPYVPSRRKDLKQAFTELYALTANDTLVDIGSGDGVVLRMASNYGAKAVGYEIHPVLVVLSRFLTRDDKNITVRFKNAWREPLPSEVTVVYAFSDSRDIRKLAARLQLEANRLGKSFAFISYGFAIPKTKEFKHVGAYYLYHFTPLQST